MSGSSTGFAPTNIKDMTNLSNLDYDRQYKEFNYDKYMNHFKQSNFIGGKKAKSKSQPKAHAKSKKMTTNQVMQKMNKLIKTMYVDYKKDKKSKLKKIAKQTIKMKMIGGNSSDVNFITPLKDMKNVSELNYSEPYEYSNTTSITHMPRSNFQSLGSYSLK